MSQDDSLESLSRLQFSNITTLNLASCSKLTDRSLTHLGKMTKLNKLNLSYCSNFTDEGLVCCYYTN